MLYYGLKKEYCALNNIIILYKTWGCFTSLVRQPLFFMPNGQITKNASEAQV